MVIKPTPAARILVRLPPDLLAEIDTVVESNDLSRNETITRMLRHALDCKRRTSDGRRT